MKLLVADDDPFTRRTIASLLEKQGYEVIAAADGLEAWNVFEKSNEPLLAIVNCRLPKLDGLDILLKARRLPQGGEIYLFAMSPLIRRAEAMKAIDLGADDFLIKPCEGQELKARLRAGKRILDLQHALQMQNNLDPVTGALNQLSVLEMLGQEISRARRESTPVSVLLVEVDHLRRMGETFGHFSSDAVLQETLRRLRELVRQYDSVGRTSEAEFLLVLPGCAMEPAIQQAKRVQTRISGKDYPLQSRSIRVTCSVGVACTDTFPHMDSDILLRGVTKALARARQQGGNALESATLDDVPITGSFRAVAPGN